MPNPTSPRHPPATATPPSRKKGIRRPDAPESAQAEARSPADLGRIDRGRTGLILLAVTIFSAAVYSIVHRARLFIDPDSFYHLKMAELIGERGLVRDFVWLPYTTLAHAFADHHLLYHLLLIPFIRLFGPMDGALIATVLFAALAIAAFHLVLVTHRVRWPLIFTLLLLSSYSILVRLNLTKANALAVTLVLLTLVAYRLRSPRFVFALAWLYVWLHGGWPMMLIVVAAYAVAGHIVERRPWRQREELRLGLAALGGLLAGLVVNPYFPINLRFYWEQIVQIAIVGYGRQIAVGLEWYPYPPADFVARNSALINAFLFCAVLAAVHRWGGPKLRRAATTNREDRQALVAALLLTLATALLTARSRRHIEYLAPIGMFTAALLTTALAERLDVGAVRARLRSFLPDALGRYLPLDLVLAAILLVVAVLYGARNVVSATDFFGHGLGLHGLEGVAGWLKANTPADSVVVNGDFAQFGPLMYWDDRNRYFCGLDPTFLYRQDPLRYQNWMQLIGGKVTDASKIGPLLEDQLGGRYFVVWRNNSPLQKVVEQSGGLTKVYEDGDAVIYEAK